ALLPILRELLPFLGPILGALLPILGPVLGALLGLPRALFELDPLLLERLELGRLRVKLLGLPLELLGAFPKLLGLAFDLSAFGLGQVLGLLRVETHAAASQRHGGRKRAVSDCELSHRVHLGTTCQERCKGGASTV